MNDPNQPQLMRDALHLMLRAALLEIRASESLNAARKIADVFHVMPSALLRCVGNEDYDAEYRKLIERATRHGLEDYVEKLKEAVTAKKGPA